MRLEKSFFQADAITLAKNLLGKKIVREFKNGERLEITINETEAYLGEEDLACHASKGRTPRTEIMYHEGGVIYVYLIYGMYWLLNVVTGSKDHPEAVLVRGSIEVEGPGRIGRYLQLDKSFYGEDLTSSKRLWIEDCENRILKIECAPRIGVNYAGPVWSKKPWRFYY